METELTNLQPTSVIMVSLDTLKKAFLEWSNSNGSSDSMQREGMLTAKATADMLKIDRSTLWRWEKEGVLTPIRLGRKVYYGENEVKRMANGYYIK